MAMTPPTKRGRPPGFERREAVAAAMELFWRKGYAGTSVPDISAATGLSASSIYNAFGSKQDLFVAVLDDYLEGPMGYMLGPLEHGEDGLADLESFFRRLESNTAEGFPPGCLAVNTIAEFGREPRAVGRRTARYRATLRRSLEAALRRAAQRGEISKRHIPERVEALTAMVISLNLLLAAAAPAAETRGLTRAALSIARS
jgi:TetR/AcrR family transcriptional repressor of nem operon